MLRIKNMVVYKITNKVNGKIYIGQTIRTVERRWKRHICDALNNHLDTKFARAIRKYGPDNFAVEIIEHCSDQSELTIREKYWIDYLDTVKHGYNETNNAYKSGGNTYQSKTDEELSEIRSKISASKLGHLNPNSTPVKARNLVTLQELHFPSVIDAQNYFHRDNHAFITARCHGKIRYAYQGQWIFALETDNYPNNFTNNKHHRTSKHIRVEYLPTHESHNFDSYSEAERFFGLKHKTLSNQARKQTQNPMLLLSTYKMTILD